MRSKYMLALLMSFACLASGQIPQNHTPQSQAPENQAPENQSRESQAPQYPPPQKTYGWVPQGTDTYRMGPGAYNGIAVFNPHGWEAMHIRLDIAAHEPVMIGVVPLQDWNNALQNRELLEKMNYACLSTGVTRLNFSCDFYASNTSRVVVVRDMRRWEHREHMDHPMVSGVGAPLARMAYDNFFANEVRVTPFSWGCTAYCDLPDPPRFGWVYLRREKYEITSAMKSYGPFTPEKDDDKIRIWVKTPFPMTVAVVPSSVVDELYENRGRAREILSRTSCKQYGVQKTSFDCTFQMSDGPQQVVLLPEVEITKKKKANIEISTVRCVANCVE